MEHDVTVVRQDKDGRVLFERQGVHFWLSPEDRAWIAAAYPGPAPHCINCQCQTPERLKGWIPKEDALGWHEALMEIASYGEGDKVTSSFDEPVAAALARKALRRAQETERIVAPESVVVERMLYDEVKRLQRVFSIIDDACHVFPIDTSHIARLVRDEVQLQKCSNADSASPVTPEK